MTTHPEYKLRTLGPVALQSDTDTLDRMYDALDRVRPSSKTVAIRALDLRQLLSDHATLTGVIRTTT